MASKKVQAWFKDVAAAMIRDRMSFRAALTALNISIPTSEAEAIERSNAFRKYLDMEQALLYQELSNNPNFDKNALVGGMLFAIQQMVREGAWDKAVEAWFKIARIQDWVGSESNVNITLGVSQRDIDEQLAKLKGEAPARVQ